MCRFIITRQIGLMLNTKFKMTKIPVYGETRDRSVFLWFPKKINSQWHWFKYYTVTEVYKKDSYLCISNYTDEIEGYSDGWIPVKYKI